MSWLVDLAGKAESLLENLDQTAGRTLQGEKAAVPDQTSRNGYVAPVAGPSHAYVPGTERSRGCDNDNVVADNVILKTSKSRNYCERLKSLP